jgi:hypothetical protein
MLKVIRMLRRKAHHRGQIAVMFVVFMALILLLVAATMNLGEVALLKTGTANAADAGALAGASWVASGTNELAKIAQGMWINVYAVQAIFTIPFCWDACWVPAVIYAILAMVNYGILKASAADPVIKAAWENAKAAALFTALQNAEIDDPSGEVQNEINELSAAFAETRSVPDTARFDWVRVGANDFEEPSWVEVSVQFLDERPELTMGGWGPWFICLSDCLDLGFLGLCCWTFPLAWTDYACKFEGGEPNCTGEDDMKVECDVLTSGDQAKTGNCWTAKQPGRKGWTLGAMWASLLDIIPEPKINTCRTCIPLPLSLPASPTTPDEIADSTGRVVVTVTQHREGGSELAFWTMSYPDQIVSEATAEYGGADAGGWFDWPDADATAELVEVL